jgi:hypothetical protein
MIPLGVPGRPVSRCKHPPQSPLQSQPRIYLESEGYLHLRLIVIVSFFLIKQLNPICPPFFVTLDWPLDLQAALSDLHHSCHSLDRW